MATRDRHAPCRQLNGQVIREARALSLRIHAYTGDVLYSWALDGGTQNAWQLPGWSQYGRNACA